MAGSFENGLTILTKQAYVEASLWRRYKLENEQLCRSEIFNRYTNYAKSLAYKQYKSRPSYGLEVSDFEQLAFSGLLEAIDRYDPLMRVPFSVYARYRIIGSIRDGIGKSSEKAAVYSHNARLESERIRSMQEQEGGDAVDKATNLVVGLAIGVMLESLDVRDIDNIASQSLNAYEVLAWRDLELRIVEAVSRLPEQQKAVIVQHYMSSIPFAQIADILGVTKGRISQIHKQAIERLIKETKFLR